VIASGIICPILDLPLRIRKLILFQSLFGLGGGAWSVVTKPPCLTPPWELPKSGAGFGEAGLAGGVMGVPEVFFVIL
jgi:hypothetical protein